MPSPTRINGIWTLNGVQLLGSTVTGTTNGDLIQLSDWFGTPALSAGTMYSDGGAGNDTIHGTSFYDIMRGGAGNDTLYDGGGTSGNAIYGNSGNDRIIASSGGTNSLYGDDGTEAVTGGNDDIRGGTALDFIYGEGGNDTLDGSLGNDFLYGGAGNDILIGGRGRDILEGGDGNDIFRLNGDGWTTSYDQPAGATTFYANTASNTTGDTYRGGSGVDRLQANENNLTLVLDDRTSLSRDSIEWLDGGLFANFRVAVIGAGPHDFTRVGLNNVTLDFREGDDTITGSSADTLIGASGNDRIDGSFGTDTVRFAGTTSGYAISYLGNGQFRVLDTLSTDGNTGSDILVNVERFEFSNRTFDLTPVNWQDTDPTGGSIVGGIAGLVSERAVNGSSTGIDVSVQASNDFLLLAPGAASITYALQNSAGGRFAIDPVTGVVTVANAALLDYETSTVLSGGTDRGYTITVQSSMAGISALRDFSIVVVDANDPPENVIDADTVTDDYVDEGAATGTYAGIQVQATDPNGDALTYSLADNAGGRFSIDAANGKLYVANGGLLDYEVAYAQSVTVRVTDSRGATTDQAFTIYLNDIASEIWSGTAASDVFTLDRRGDWTLNGLSGDDVLSGHDGANVTFVGGSGNDTLAGRAGSDIFMYSGAAEGLDAVDGGDGYDIVQATANNTTIGLTSLVNVEEISSGGFSNIALQFGARSDVFNSDLIALNGIAAIRAGAGDDTIIGSGGNESILGEDGNDSIRGGAGADTLNGGAGIDTVSFDANWTGTTVNLATNAVAGGDADGDTIVSFENVTGSDHGDVITGSAAANVITGGAGDDTLNGGDGNDTFLVGLDAGFDSLFGGNGTDRVLFLVDNAALGLSALAAVENFDATGVVNATIVGSEIGNALSFSLSTLTNIAGVFGMDGNDTITGSAASDTIIGGSGDDVLNGGNGDDVFRYLGGEDGFDVINGGAGRDSLEATGFGVSITIASLTAIEAISGKGDTIIQGSAAGNSLNFSTVALSGIAAIDGGDGNDNLIGSNGDDNISGGNGGDRLTGGTGLDQLRGDAGQDVFDFNGSEESALGQRSDIILDFVRWEDRIDVTTIDANLLVAGDQNFTFIGTGPFSKSAGQLRYDAPLADGYTRIYGDVDGDGVANFEIRLQGTYALAATDFIL